MKNAFDGFISGVCKPEERMNELENRSTEITQTKRQREKRRKQNRTPRSFGKI